MTRIFQALLVLALAPGLFEGAENAPLRLVQTIPLPDVQGRIDHFGIDLKGKRLFMAALGNNTVEVFDLDANTWLRSIPGLHHPQGVLYVPETERLFVANAEGGDVAIFDGKTLTRVGSVDGLDDADNIRYDETLGRVYVGYGDGALVIVDAKEGKRQGEIKLEGHPESFQIEKSAPRMFVNVPDAGHVAVIDRVKRKVIARWPLPGASANFPMALDEADHRLFVGCRKPAMILVFDTNSGKVITRVKIPGDADDLWYDATWKRLYVSGGEGFIGIIGQRDADHYEALTDTPTATGARTCFFSPDFMWRLFLAVPHRGTQPAELRVYYTAP